MFYEFLPLGQIVDEKWYLRAICQLREAIRHHNSRADVLLLYGMIVYILVLR